MNAEEKMEREWYETRVAFLLSADRVPVPALAAYPDLEDLLKDSDLVANLVANGLTQSQAESVQRWAQNISRSKGRGFPQIGPDDVMELGAIDPTIMIYLSVAFPTMYVIAHSLPSDLVQVVPYLTTETASAIVANARAYVETFGRPHYHQMIVISYEDGKEKVTEMPPYDTRQGSPVDQVIFALEHLGLGKPKPEDTD